ncbi:MAG: hypothetical protein CMN32_09945 [Saprospirales bacterium]|nr:hypothetical protein [Saprospirales bacterium]
MEKHSLLQILSQFVPLEGIQASAQLSGGHINSTYRVDAVLAGGRKEKLLLQKINTSVFEKPEEVMENIATTAKHLSETDYGMKVLSPMPTKTGAWLVWENGEAWRLFPFIENTICHSIAEHDETAYDAAWAFGHFMAKLGSFDEKKLHLTIPRFHNSIFRIRQFKEAVEKAEKDRLGQAAELLRELNGHLDCLEKIESLPLPLRVVHHDAKISNVLFDETNNRPVAVIDLDTIMPGRIISDFGDLVRSMASTVSEEEEDPGKVAFLPARYEALEAGFLEGLSDDIATKEKKALPAAGPWLTLMQSLRFLTDFLMGDVYYQVSHERQNFFRARNQFALFKSMKAELADRLIVC